jgi:DNA-binding transcriptional MerR regulator
LKYTIGDFSKILGITVDTLRLYEKCGIVKPIKNKENNYRYFNDLDARNLLLSKWYRSMEISLNDVTNLVNNPTIEKITQKIKETELDLKEKIKMNTLLLNKISKIKKDIIEIQYSLYQFKIKKLPGIYRLKQTDKDSLLENNSLKDVANSWINSFPYSFHSCRLDKKSFFEENYLNYNWGLAIFEDEMQYFDLTINDATEYISAQTYLSTILLATDSEEYLSKSSIQFIIDYLSQNNYTVVGDIIGKLIITEKVNLKDQTYIELDIAINIFEL